MTTKKSGIFQIILSAMFLAIALILPLITGQIQKIGNALCPMHIPVLLCGFFCGPIYGLIVGFIAPLLRFALFGMPPIVPAGIGMCFELATYGLVSGMMYKIFPKKKIYIYASLIIAMIAGRIVWGLVRTLLYGLIHTEFGLEAFIAGAFLNAIPGIIVQLLLIPLLVMLLKRQMNKQP